MLLQINSLIFIFIDYRTICIFSSVSFYFWSLVFNFWHILFDGNWRFRWTINILFLIIFSVWKFDTNSTFSLNFKRLIKFRILVLSLFLHVEGYLTLDLPFSVVHEHLLLDGIRQLSRLKKLHIQFLLLACDWVDTEIFTKVYYASNIIAEIVITSISVG